MKIQVKDFIIDIMKNVISILFLSILAIFILYTSGGKEYMVKASMGEKAVSRVFNENAYLNKREVINTMNIFKKLPDKVVRIIVENSIKIDYLPWLINDIPNYQGQYNFNVSGVFDGENSRIVLQYDQPKGEDIFNKYFIEINTFHEIGHSFDYDYLLKKYGYSYSQSQEFIAAYKEEAVKLFSMEEFKEYNYIQKEFFNFFINNQQEYFAECFGLYFASDETNKILREKAPKTYQYIKKIIH